MLLRAYLNEIAGTSPAITIFIDGTHHFLSRRSTFASSRSLAM
jgi:hypothetical protein